MRNRYKPSYLDSLFPPEHFDPVKEIIQESARTFEERIKAYLIENLKKAGFKFRSDQDFLNFAINRLTRINFAEEPNRFLFYIDYVDQRNKGIFIGEYDTTVDINFEDNKISATFGHTFRTNEKPSF